MHWTAAVTAAIVLLVPAVPHRAVEVEPIDRSVVIRGRVLDERDRPVADALVGAVAPAMGPVLGLAQPHGGGRVRTGADGRFDLPVPFGEVLYSLHVERVGYDSPWPRVLPKAAGDANALVEVRLKRGSHSKVEGQVAGPDGRPAAGAQVTLVGEYGYAASTTAGDDGAFRFDEVPEYVGQAVPVARAGGLVAPQMIVRGPRGAPLQLALGEPGRIEGRVTERAGEARPVAGAVVAARPWFSSGFAARATADAEGRYVLDGLPPGGYLVEAAAPMHFDKPPRGQGHERQRVEVPAGGAARFDVAMRRCALVRGRVLDSFGKPAAGALVAMPCTWDGDYRDQVRAVRADADGAFRIATGHVEEEGLSLSAFSARAGLASVQLQPLAEGEVREGIVLTLPGAIRVRGVVTDGHGKGVAGVTCIAGAHEVIDVSQEGGAFDLGRLSLPRQQRPAVLFRTPRPSTVRWVVRPDGGAVDPDAAGYFEDATVPFDALVDQEVELKVALRPTELLTIDGRVVDAGGKAVAGARLFVFSGNAGEETWAERAVPRRSGSFSSARLVGEEDKMLSSETAGADGRFRLRALRFDGEATAAAGTRFSVGVVVGDRGVKLIKDVTLPAGTTRREFEARVELPAADADADGDAGEPQPRR